MFLMCMCVCLCEYMLHVGIHRGQKRAIDCLELGFQEGGEPFDVGAGNWTRVPQRKQKVL